MEKVTQAGGNWFGENGGLSAKNGRCIIFAGLNSAQSGVSTYL
jgi:hypothetical protein